MYKLGLEKAEDQRSNCQHPLVSKKQKSSEKHLLLLYWLCQSLDCVDHNKLEKFSRDGNARQPNLPPEKTVCKSREATVRNKHGTMGWFQSGKGVPQGCILPPCLFNLYAEYIMWNARLDEAQAGIKIAGEISITSDTQDDTTLMAESQEELNSLLMKMKGESKKVG